MFRTLSEKRADIKVIVFIEVEKLNTKNIRQIGVHEKQMLLSAASNELSDHHNL